MVHKYEYVSPTTVEDLQANCQSESLNNDSKSANVSSSAVDTKPQKKQYALKISRKAYKNKIEAEGKSYFSVAAKTLVAWQQGECGCSSLGWALVRFVDGDSGNFLGDLGWLPSSLLIDPDDATKAKFQDCGFVNV
eukprot:GHVO01028058.1.p1 GENE.GHVO01028058.1~~GHVO01028058.1.p1  ORF type:complete len:136 (-),score=15.39 GHVO01028058.1:144-551(-)